MHSPVLSSFAILTLSSLGSSVSSAAECPSVTSENIAPLTFERVQANRYSALMISGGTDMGPPPQRFNFADERQQWRWPQGVGLKYVDSTIAKGFYDYDNHWEGMPRCDVVRSDGEAHVYSMGDYASVFFRQILVTGSNNEPEPRYMYVSFKGSARLSYLSAVAFAQSLVFNTLSAESAGLYSVEGTPQSVALDVDGNQVSLVLSAHDAVTGAPFWLTASGSRPTAVQQASPGFEVPLRLFEPSAYGSEVYEHGNGKLVLSKDCRSGSISFEHAGKMQTLTFARTKSCKP